MWYQYLGMQILQTFTKINFEFVQQRTNSQWLSSENIINTIALFNVHVKKNRMGGHSNAR